MAIGSRTVEEVGRCGQTTTVQRAGPQYGVLSGDQIVGFVCGKPFEHDKPEEPRPGFEARVDPEHVAEGVSDNGVRWRFSWTEGSRA